jgi:hypothetical protein
MYCKIDNDQIGWPQSLPNKHGNVVGGFDKLSDTELKEYGFYPYVEPEFDPIMQELGALVFIVETETVTRIVLEKQIDIATEKAAKICLAKLQANGLLSKTDWYVIRKMERGVDVPEDIQAERAAIITRSNEIETEINALTSVREVLTYNIQF